MSVSPCPTQQQRGGELVLELIVAGADQGIGETTPHHQTWFSVRHFYTIISPRNVISS